MKTRMISMDDLRGEWCDGVADEHQEDQLRSLLERLRNTGIAGDQVHEESLTGRQGNVLHVAVKGFRPRPGFQSRGSPAERSFHVACRLRELGIGTPPPIAYLDEPLRGRRRLSFYVCELSAASVNFRAALIQLFRREPQCEKFMALLRTVAAAVRRLHDAGIQHRDLGNQNILVQRAGPADWRQAQFVDLNRCRLKAWGLTPRERAFDVSRIFLPSEFLRIFKEMYFDGRAPAEFESWERRFRRQFAVHTWSRILRHPLRTRRRRRAANPDITYPSRRDLWVWDARSVQPVNTVRREERKKLVSTGNHLRVAGAVAAALPGAYSGYREWLRRAFTEPVDLRGRIGMSVEPRAETAGAEWDLLEALNRPPLLLRFYRHENEAAWDRIAAWARHVRERGHEVAVALVQDRAAVKEPALWRDFVRAVLSRVADVVEWVELGHAINRVKWGIWDLREYGRFLEAMREVPRDYPQLKFMGPAAIDFEYHYLAAALRAVPAGFRFDALSHHLYVDRRGAPENRQGFFSALEKLALARALAGSSPSCGDRLVVSEVNWPLRDAGVHAPVGAPYLFSGQQLASPPCVTEDEYADYMIRYLLIALCSGLAERVYWWRLVHRGFGLVDDTEAGRWRKRPAFHMLKVFLDLAGTATFTERRVFDDGVECYRFARDGESPIALIYCPRGERIFEPSFRFQRALDAFGTPIREVSPLRVNGRPKYLIGVT